VTSRDIPVLHFSPSLAANYPEVNLMKRLSLAAILCAFLSSATLAATYYIPHIHTSNDAWETYLLLSNSSADMQAECAIRLYDEDGILLTTFYVTVEPGETRSYSLRSYGGVTGTVDCAAGYLSARIGFVASASSGGGTAEFALSTELSGRVKLDLSNYYDQLTWSGFALFNGTDESVTVTPRYMTTDGMSHTGTPFTLGSMQKRVDYFENELGEPFTNLNTVVFEADTPALTAIVISGKQNEKLLFTGSGNHADTWEMVDRYPGTSYTARFDCVGQVVMGDRVLYALSADDNFFPFGNLVKCVDKETGVQLWQHVYDPQIIATGFTAATTGNALYLYGQLDVTASTQYVVLCINPANGDVIYQRVFVVDAFDYAHNFKKNILVAATGGSVAIVFQTPDNQVARYLYNETLETMLGTSTWVMDTVVTDLITFNGRYYMLRSGYNETDLVYNQLNLYHFPSNSLVGGGSAYDIATPLSDGNPYSLYADGSFVRDDTLYTMLKICLVGPLYGEARNNVQAAAMRMYRIDLDGGGTTLGQVIQGRFLTMGANMTMFEGPEEKVFLCGSNWYHSMLVHIQFSESETYSCEIPGPVTVEGDDFYVVSCDEDRSAHGWNGGYQTYLVRTQRTSFTDFYLGNAR